MTLYLYNILLFVDWPETVLKNHEFIIIGILGGEDIAQALLPILGRTVKGKRIAIKRFSGLDDMDEFCHVLFIGVSAKDMLPRILEKMHNKRILTVSDMSGFARMGGMIGIHLPTGQGERNANPMKNKRGKRFEVNLSVLKNAGLGIRSRLLRLADVIEGET